MRGSLKLLTVAGIGLYIHWTFAILIIGLPLLYLSGGAGWAEAMQGLIFILAVFGCVVLHEYRHAHSGRSDQDPPFAMDQISPITRQK